jgi:hypothetical protein
MSSGPKLRVSVYDFVLSSLNQILPSVQRFRPQQTTCSVVNVRRSRVQLARVAGLGKICRGTWMRSRLNRNAVDGLVDPKSECPIFGFMGSRRA